MANDEPSPPQKRHLPILNERPAGTARSEGGIVDGAEGADAKGASSKGEREDRPVWRHVSYGVVATFLVWLPLSVLVETVMNGGETRDQNGSPTLVVFHGIAFFAGALAGGGVTARVWASGDSRPGSPLRQGATAGAAAAALAWVIAIFQGAHGGALVWGLLLLILLTMGSGAGALGGRLFRKR